MSIITILLLNWDSVLFFVLAVGCILWLYRKRELGMLWEVLFAYITDAERDYGDGTGELKKAAVFRWVYDKLPAVLKLIITAKQLERMIEDVLAYAKRKWAANPNLRDYIGAYDLGDAVTDK